jgi:F-type H+-transporting ATPase subunit delta
LKFARGKIGMEQALLGLKQVKDIMRDNHAFKELLQSPEIGVVDKCRIIDEVLEGTSAQIKYFLKLLIDKGRIVLFEDIAEYARGKYAHAGETEVLLKTTFPVDLSLLKKIKAALEKKINGRVKLYIELDSGLLGGIQVIIGNTIIDGSVRKRLEGIKEKLLSVSLE